MSGDGGGAHSDDEEEDEEQHFGIPTMPTFNDDNCQ